MASEIRVNKINSQTGVGTITLSPTGVDISGITTAATLRATTGVVTTFEATTGNITTLRAPTGIVTTLTTNTLTANSTAKVGSGVTLSPDGDIFATGVCTASSFSGDGSNLTGLSGVSVANQSDNRLITATGTTDALNAESGAIITADSELIVGMTAAGGAAEDARLQVRGDTYARAKIQILGTHNDDNPVGLTLAKSRSSGNTILGDSDDIGQIDFASNDGNGFHNVGRIMVSHDGSGNGNDDLPSMMRFFTTANGGVTLSERLRISSSGDLLYANNDPNYASWYHSPDNANTNAAINSAGNLTFSSVQISNSAYSTSNGRYTAPVDGLYFIRANGLVDNNASAGGLFLQARKNDSQYGPNIAYNTRVSGDSTSKYQLLSGTAIMYMSANDYVTIYAAAGMHASSECNFIVYLIRGTI